jgi:hypothetical protein
VARGPLRDLRPGGARVRGLLGAPWASAIKSAWRSGQRAWRSGMAATGSRAASRWPSTLER